MTSRPAIVSIDGSPIRMRRTTCDVIELWGEDDLDFARGLGFPYAHDRMVQLTLARLFAQGRLSECLQATDEAQES